MKRYCDLEDNQKLQIKVIALLACFIKASGFIEDNKVKAAMDLLKSAKEDIYQSESIHRTLISAINLEIDFQELCRDIGQSINYEERIILLRALYCFGFEIQMNWPQLKFIMEDAGYYLKITLFDQSRIRVEFKKELPIIHYVRLGLKPGATKFDVKRAYRQLALKYHPDRIQHLGQAAVKISTMRLQRINEAYAELLRGLP